MTTRILIIAGSDSGGGAGVQADIKTVTMFGGHAMTAITAVTAQNTLGVDAVHAVPAEMVIAQMDAVMRDLGVDAIKIGMIGSAQTANAIADHLAQIDVPVIFDPVMVATSGARLADTPTIAAFGRIMSIATLVTPNIPELAALGGEGAILAHGCHLLVKGGHDDGDILTDRLVRRDGTEISWRDARIDTPHTHGTGCTLSTAIAAAMGRGMAVEQAVERARLFTRLALYDAPGLGGGHGPMGHQFVREDAVVAGASLNQITVGATDYDASVRFYKALGLKQIVDSPANGYARFEAENGVTFSIHAVEKSGGSTVIYFEHMDLDNWCVKLRGQGLEFDHMPQDEDWGWREARLRDPGGNIICLYAAGENRRYPPWRI